MGNCTFCQRRVKKQKGGDTFSQSSEEGTKFACVHLQLHPHNSSYFDIVSLQTRDEMVRSAERLADDLQRRSLKAVAEVRGGNVIYQQLKGVFEDQPGTSDLIQNFYGDEAYGYPARVWLFYLLNKELDDPHIDVYELIDSECQSDWIIMMYRARTKKFLMIEPREYVMVRYIRCTGPGAITDVQQSVEVLGLATDPLIAHALQRVKGSLVKVYLKASIYEDRGLACRGLSVVKSDMRSSASLTILKPFLATSLKRMLPRLANSVVEFYRHRRWEDGRKVLWFDTDYDAVLNAFEMAQQENEKDMRPIDQRMKLSFANEHQTSN